MNSKKIEHLAELLKRIKDKGLPKPIVFLGAGASKSGNIPLASEIVNDILEKYGTLIKVKELPEKERTYANLMKCLEVFDRKELLRGYIEKAKINVTHLYLAQLMMEGYVDYVLTVNFDNLMLRALALYNYFPPTYDMAILKDLTTADYNEKSVFYLHGTHNGLWLLNTKEEMAKPYEVLKMTMAKISTNRPWIVIGYSGEDPIIEHIKNLGSFEHGLYWVAYKDNDPSERVCNGLLNDEIKNCSVIKGYDADSFMLELNTKLGLEQPPILEKPFTALQKTLENIVDIEDEEPYRNVKERLKTDKEYVELAIGLFEEDSSIVNLDELREKVAIGSLKKQIIDVFLNNSYEESQMKGFLEKAKKLKNIEINELLSDAYSNWGLVCSRPTNLNKYGSFEKFEQAILLNPRNVQAFNYWGGTLSKFAKGINDEKLYEESIAKYEIAAKLNPNDIFAFIHGGNTLFQLAKLKNDESLYKESIEKYRQATIINPQYASAFNNWSVALMNLAKLKKDENLLKEAIEICRKAIALGASSYNLACCYALKKDKMKAFELLEQCLKNKEIETSHVEADEDWKAFWQDPEFLMLIEQ